MQVFDNPAQFILSFDFAEKGGFVDVTRIILGFAKRNPDAKVSDVDPLMRKLMQENGVSNAVLLKVEDRTYCVMREYLEQKQDVQC